MKKIIVLYHKNCPDGFGAAWAAWKKFKNKAEYMAMDPRTMPAISIRNKQIFALDGSIPTNALKKLLEKKNRITIIDHHSSNEEEVKDASEYVFDIKHSAAILAWDYFHPKKAVPMFLKYVEDGDLWKWRLPNSLAINSYITTHDFSFKTWDKVWKNIENPKMRVRVIDYGKTLLRSLDLIVEEIVRKADLVKFEGYKAFAANASSKKFVSAVGAALYKKLPPIGIIWYRSKGYYHISLRSDGTVNVSNLAAKWGGGGHAASAAFILPATKNLPWKYL